MHEQQRETIRTEVLPCRVNNPLFRLDDCHFENGCGSDRMEYIKATKNDEFWQYIDEVNGEGAHENG